MRKIQSLVLVMVFILLCSAVWAVGLAFNNFSADIATTRRGETQTSKMYSKDGKMRMEVTGRGSDMITITRPDKKVIWMIMPANNSYMEMPINKQNNDVTSQLSDPNVKSDKKFIANETVDGHPAKKYSVTILRGGKNEAAGFVWEATDMNNFLIKHQSADLETTTVWKNIKTGSVSDSLFEVPAGYTKKSMPSMGMPPMGGSNMRPKGK